MRYAQKLVCAILLVLGVSFAAGGCVVLYGDFADRLSLAQAQNAESHRQACATVEQLLISRSRQGSSLDDDILDSLLTELGLAEAASLVPPTVPEEVALYSASATGQVHSLTLLPGQTALLGSGGDVTEYDYSELWGGYRLLTSYPLGDLFAARDRSLRRYLLLEAAVLCCAAVVSAWLAHRMTKPLAVLTAASTRMAAGEYGRRTALCTGDEMETLSQSFDAMAAAVEEKIDQLELGVRQREDFMAAFTHELKTPMTSIIGYADLLRTAQPSPEEQQEAAESIFREGRRLETLSLKLLSLLGLGETPLTLAETPIQTVLDRLTAACPAMPLEVAPCPAFVLCDGDLLLDLFYNLVQNAARASGPDAPPVRVYCAEAPGQSRLTVTVEDGGCGIPPEALPRVTEPFYMVDRSRARRQGGSGLGLALCQRIAQAHGGRLTLESTVGKGTRVQFTLPLAGRGGERHEA